MQLKTRFYFHARYLKLSYIRVLQIPNIATTLQLVQLKQFHKSAVGSSTGIAITCQQRVPLNTGNTMLWFPYWKEIRCRFSPEKRTHFDFCALMPEVLLAKTTDEVVILSQTLSKKWGHLMPFASALESELLCWQNLWRTQPVATKGINVTSLYCPSMRAIYIFLNIRELLKMLAVLPLGRTESERLFSYFCLVHNWLRNTMTTERLLDLAVIFMNGRTVSIDRMEICRHVMVA